MSKKKPVVIGNWKMHKTNSEAVIFIKEYLSLMSQKTTLYLAVPFTAIKMAADAAAGSAIVIGAQNVSDIAEGPLTGEVSAPMLCDVAAQFVILGHSERRRFFAEDDNLINRKIRITIQYGLQPLLCIGENAEQRSKDSSEQVVKSQLLSCLEGITDKQLNGLMIAYEPVWAIGTGVTPTADQANQMISMCRKTIADKWDKMTAQKVRLLYGGSVLPSNAREFTAQSEIDGLLVGGASLSVATFMEIVDNAIVSM